MRITPEPAYSIRTGTIPVVRDKVYINISKDNQVPAPVTVDVDEIAYRLRRGEQWVVPIVASPERWYWSDDDGPMHIFDCCVHPTVVDGALVGQTFLNMFFEETCLQLIEEISGYQFDRTYYIKSAMFPLDIITTEVVANAPRRVPRPRPAVMVGETVAERKRNAALLDAMTPSSPKGPVSVSMCALKTDIWGLKFVPPLQATQFTRPWLGEDSAPHFEVEAPSDTKRVAVIGAALHIDDKVVPLPKRPTQVRAIHTQDDDVLHVFVWVEPRELDQWEFAGTK